MIFTVKSIISLVISPVVSATTRLGVTPCLCRVLLLHSRCLLLGVRRLFARSVFVGGVFALLARGVGRLRGCGRRPRVLLPLAAAGLRLPLRLRSCRGARARGLAVAARPAAGPGAARGLRGGGGVRRRGRGGGAVVALLLAAPPPAGRVRADLPVGGGAVALLAPVLVVMLVLVVVVMVLPVVAAVVVRPRVPVMAPAPLPAPVTSSAPVAAAVLLHAVLAAATSPPAVVVVTPAATPANDTKY